MYWTRSLLKQNAKQVLRESYWRVFLAWLLISLGAGAAAGVLSNIVLFVPTLVVSLATIGSPEAYLAGILFVYLLFLVFILVFNALVTMPLTVGGIRYTMENRCGYPPLDSVLSPFRNKEQYLNVAKATLMYLLEIFGFTLLFIVPGIVRGYQLRYVPYLLAENPYMSYRRAKELSKADQRRKIGDLCSGPLLYRVVSAGLSHLRTGRIFPAALRPGHHGRALRRRPRQGLCSRAFQ